MTEDQMKEQLQAAQDMLETVAQQRDGANNQVVQLMAQVKALQRKVAELEKDEAEPVTANGHAEASAALQ